MKYSALALSLLAVFAVTGCKPRPTSQEQEQEIEKRVAQKVAEERLHWQQKMLDQKARELAAREQQLDQREQDAVAAATPASPASTESLADYQVGNDQVGGGPCSSYNIFYRYLTPYGAWFDLPYYGLVWQPSVAANDPRWRPYTIGQWAYSDAGWTWITGEPFGWATYHYGRWTRLSGIGWAWVPGNQWGPAWVAWRTSNDDYLGWAPLPPEIRVDVGASVGPAVDTQGRITSSWYCFVPFISFGEPNLSRELVPAEESGAIMNHSANITDITANNTAVVNHGPSVAEIQRRSRTPVSVLKVVRNNSLSPQQQTAQNGVLEIPGSFIGKGAEPVQLPPNVTPISQQASLNTPRIFSATPAPDTLQPVAAQPNGVVAQRTDPVQTASAPQSQQSPMQAIRRPAATTPTPWATPAPAQPVEPPRKTATPPPAQAARPPEHRAPEPPRVQEPPPQVEPTRTPESPKASEPSRAEPTEHSKVGASASPR